MMEHNQQQQSFTHVLPNGLRMVHITTGSHVGWCGLVVGAGSRDDAQDKQGLAHFVEHTLFKGTKHRRSWHILNRMETVGGELNAYTTKEDTTLYSIFPSQHLERAIELIADLTTNSLFPAQELEREKDVVLEEIASYRDTPCEAIYDDYEGLMFSPSALGHNILGNEWHVESMTTTDCLNYLKKLYVPSNMVFFSLGPALPERVFRLVEKHLGHMHHRLERDERTAPVPLAPQQQVVQAGLHQSHTIVGAPTASMYAHERYALALFNNLLGGPGMNSLLNVNMRERRGLVYTVESSVASFTDCGIMEIYFGCDEKNINKSLNIVAHTIDQLAQSTLSERRLETFKKQYCGQLLVASAGAEFTAMNAGKSMLYWNKVSNVQHAIEHIMAVTPQQLMAIAGQVSMPLCTTLTFK